MTFRNKGLDAIKLGNVFHLEEAHSLLPNLLNEDENLPTIVYSLGGTIRRKLFNYKKNISEIDADDPDTYDIASCHSENSAFCDLFIYLFIYLQYLYRIKTLISYKNCYQRVSCPKNQYKISKNVLKICIKNINVKYGDKV